MKTRILQRELRELSPIVYFRYCEIQYLLQFESPIYYTAGIYWRKADIYRIEIFWHTVYIYKGYGTKGNIWSIPYKITQEYEMKAREENREETRREGKRDNNRALLGEMLANNGFDFIFKD